MEFKGSFHPLEKGVYLPLVTLGAFLSIAALTSFTGCLVSWSSDMFSMILFTSLNSETEHLLHMKKGIAWVKSYIEKCKLGDFLGACNLSNVMGSTKTLTFMNCHFLISVVTAVFQQSALKFETWVIRQIATHVANDESNYHTYWKTWWLLSISINKMN